MNKILGKFKLRLCKDCQKITTSKNLRCSKCDTIHTEFRYEELRGELQFSEIENYLIKKSTVSELAVDGTVEIIGGPFKGMKATITRVDHDKEEATVILLDAPYQLPVTVDANYLKAVSS